MAKKVNPLISLAKIMRSEIDKFAVKYDNAEDKDALIHSLGDLHNLTDIQKSNGMYASITNAVGITDDIYNDCLLHMFHNHSNQGGVNRCGDDDRLRALSDFVVQAYVDVSSSNISSCLLKVSFTLELILCLIMLFEISTETQQEMRL